MHTLLILVNTGLASSSDNYMTVQAINSNIQINMEYMLLIPGVNFRCTSMAKVNEGHDMQNSAMITW